ncbi:MAG: TonB-dependent receptor, partial [Bacteroidota bacterium]
MIKNLCALIITLFLMSNAVAQTQIVKGLITDKQSEMPLIGATISLVGTDNLGATTDIDGYFRLPNVPIGRHDFQVSYLGYNSITLPNVVVTTGKEVMLNIALEESLEQLNEVVVTAEVEKDRAINEMATISARTFSVEEVNRYSGGRSDVARLAGNFAGVSTSDDSRNDIVIRGNSPTGVLWRLEGVPIPNPNHFSTLGTTGGPVSAMNPNLLSNSDFLTSAFPAEYGNALAGVFDLSFRDGNRDNYEFMIQTAAFSGFEAMAEGPINKNNGSSFIVAGRYSFVGLAGNLGLDIGTNAIPNYYDLSFKVNFGNSPIGRFTLFGIGGRSDVFFDRDDIAEDDLFAFPDEDSYADSQFGVLGLKHNLFIDDKTYLRTVISTSNSGNVFTRDRFFNEGTAEEFSLRLDQNDNSTNRYSISSYINRKFNARLTGRAGILVENEQHDVQYDIHEGISDFNGDGQIGNITVYDFEEGATMIQPFAQVQYRFTSQWTLNAGLHAQYLDLNDNVALEPRVAVNWNFAPKQTLNLGYGLHQQSHPLPILLIQEEVTEGIFEETNRDLKFTRSHHFVLGYDVKLGKSWRGKVETYYQAIDRVPVDPFSSSFSLLNLGADFGFPIDAYGLVSEGTGYNTGVELTLEKFFSDGFYGLLTTSIFDSKYEGSDGIERNTAFNNGYV